MAADFAVQSANAVRRAAASHGEVRHIKDSWLLFASRRSSAISSSKEIRSRSVQYRVK
jgi:hypothetical protein